MKTVEVLSKAKGQLARLAMVIHSLQNAVSEDNDEWNYVIDDSSVHSAKVVLDYLIDEKFALMSPEKKVTCIQTGSLNSENTINTGSTILDNHSRYLSKFLTFRDTSVIASDVSKYRLMPPKDTQDKNKYPAKECREFMKEISTAGFGTVDEISKEGSYRKTFTFRKRPYEELGESQHETLKRLHLHEENYKASFNSSSSSDSFLQATASDYESDITIDLQSPE